MKNLDLERLKMCIFFFLVGFIDLVSWMGVFVKVRVDILIYLSLPIVMNLQFQRRMKYKVFYGSINIFNGIKLLVNRDVVGT